MCGTNTLSAQRPPALGWPRSALPVHARCPHRASRHLAGRAWRSACCTRYVSAQRPPAPGKPLSKIARAAQARCPHSARRHLAGRAQRSAFGTSSVSAQRLPAPGGPRLGVRTGPPGIWLVALSALRARRCDTRKVSNSVRTSSPCIWRVALSALRAAHARYPHSARRHLAGHAQRSACGTR